MQLQEVFNGRRTMAGVQGAEARKRELLAACDQAIENGCREVGDPLLSIAGLREPIAVGSPNEQ
jgi:outer membrane protein TolC